MSGVNLAYLALMGAALLLMGPVIVAEVILAFWRAQPGIARINTRALLSLKIWVFLVLAWFSWTITHPGSVTRTQRTAFAIGLCLYLIAQSAAVLVALVRWWGWPRRWRERAGPKRGAIPDLGDER